jgi:hypothetical protein
MKTALKLSLLLSVMTSAISLAGFLYALAGLLLAGWLAQVINHPEYERLEHSFHVWSAYLFASLAVAIWLWRTYRIHYGRLWRSN